MDSGKNRRMRLFTIKRGSGRYKEKGAIAQTQRPPVRYEVSFSWQVPNEGRLKVSAVNRTVLSGFNMEDSADETFS